MAKFTGFKHISGCSLLIPLLLGLVIFYFFYTTTREGVVFTPYDNRTLFTKPWNEFCIPSAPSCQKPFLEKPGMIGVFPIGCGCKGVGQAKSPPEISDDCYDIDHNQFYSAF